MKLKDTSQQAATKYAGRDTITIPGGKTFKIETSPNGEEILNQVVPEGKTWVVDMNVKITES